MRHTRSTENVNLSDTSETARKIYLRRMKEMSASERLAAVIGLWKAGRSLQTAALRRQHPTASEEEITFLIAASQWGRELAENVYRKKR